MKEQSIVREKENESAQKPQKASLQTLRKIGLILTAISGAIIAAPVQLPQVVLAIVTYLGVIGTIATAVGKIISGDNMEVQKSSTGRQMPA